MWHSRSSVGASWVPAAPALTPLWGAVGAGLGKAMPPPWEWGAAGAEGGGGAALAGGRRWGALKAEVPPQRLFVSSGDRTSGRGRQRGG